MGSDASLFWKQIMKHLNYSHLNKQSWFVLIARLPEEDSCESWLTAESCHQGQRLSSSFHSAVLVGMTLSPLGCKEVARYPATNSTSREEGGSCSGVSSVCPCYWKPRASQGLPYITPFTLRPRGLSGQPSFSRA